MAKSYREIFRIESAKLSFTNARTFDHLMDESIDRDGGVERIASRAVATTYSLPPITSARPITCPGVRFVVPPLHGLERG